MGDPPRHRVIADELRDAILTEATLLGVALTAYEQWLADESASLLDVLGEAFDVVGRGLGELSAQD